MARQDRASLEDGSGMKLEAYRRSLVQRVLGTFAKYSRSDATEFARDVVQETLIRAWKARDRFDHRHSLFTWLRAICDNAAKDELKRESNAAKHMSPLEEVPESVVPGATDLAQAPALSADLMEAITDAETHLQKRHRQGWPVYHLVHHRDMTIDEAAATLGISRGAVKSRLHRAREAVRQQLRPYLQTP